MAHKTLYLHDNINQCEFISSTTLHLLQDNGIHSILDLVLIFPKNYCQLIELSDAYSLDNHSSDLVFIKGLIKRIAPINKLMSYIIVQDNRGYEAVITFFGSKYKLWLLQKDKTEIGFLGKIDGINKHGTLNIINASVVFASNYKFLPIYGARFGLNNDIWNLVFNKLSKHLTCIDNFDQIRPSIRSEENIMHIADAVKHIHWPNSSTIEQIRYNRILAEQRLFIDEFVAHCLINRRMFNTLRTIKTSINYHKINIFDQIHSNFLSKIKFTLRDKQIEVIKEIFHWISDEDNTKHMVHLLQGDVGTGKTLVFTAAIEQILANKYSVVVLVPNKLLGQQHYEFLKMLLESPVYYLYGSLTDNQKREIYDMIQQPRPCVLISTTSCFNEQVYISNLALIIIDEQHKFGVEQITHLSKTKLIKPHIIIVSATPLPRTVGIQYAGMMKTSSLEYLKERQVQTLIMSDVRRPEIINFLALAIKDNKQAYWICPLKKYVWGDNMSINNLKQLLQINIPHIRLDIITGDTNKQEADNILMLFKQRKLDVIITTTVIEVGIDAPQVNIMIIESASSFGLSQLHQLRGRIGRDNNKGYCILLYSANKQDNAKAKRKLNIIKNKLYGADIAVSDLYMRGVGNIAGLQQSGFKHLKTLQSRYNHLQDYAYLLANNIGSILSSINNKDDEDAIINFWKLN